MTNSIIEDNMPDKWLQPISYKTKRRLYEIQQMQSHIPSYCPECGEQLTVDDEEIYCHSCGLVTQASYNYVAGFKYFLPHGLRLG